MPNDTTPAAAPAPAAQAPATPTPGAAATGGAAEPQAAAPAAAEPQAAATTHDTFGWDKWDGKPEGLPEEVRGWGTKFNEHYRKQFEPERLSYQEKLAQSQAQEAQWKRLYSAQGVEEDPRIADLSGKVKTYETAFTKYQEEKTAESKALAEEFEKANNDYFSFVVAQNKDFFDALTPELREAVANATEHLPLHAAVDYAKLGPKVLEEALKLSQQGVAPDAISRVIQAERTMAKAGTPPKAPSPAAAIVAGNAPTTPPPRVPTAASPRPQGREGLLAEAARKAIASETRRPGRPA
jgi:hypothetical protein